MYLYHGIYYINRQALIAAICGQINERKNK